MFTESVAVPQIDLQKQAVRSFTKLILFEIPCDPIFPLISILVMKLSASPMCVSGGGELQHCDCKSNDERGNVGLSKYCKCLRNFGRH